jgi:multicomponent Na+:H+ antiporter subunit B
MRHNTLLRTVSSLILPFIFMFGWYILFHGKVSPGGGFQGGAVCSTALILHALIFGSEETEKIFSRKLLKFTACMGALIYAGVGFLTIFMGGKYLDYNALASDPHTAQFIGVMAIEVGVQLTVFAGLTLIFLKLAEQD